MKILHFVHNYYGFSGASRQAKNIASAINNHYQDIEQAFLSLGGSVKKNKEKELFNVYSSKNAGLKRCLYFVYILYKLRPDILHMHGADFALLIIAKLFGTKIYWKSTLYQSDDFGTLTSGRFGRVKKWLIKLIDCNNTLTKQIFNVNKEYLSVEKLVTIPNGVDIPKDIDIVKEKIAVIVSAIIPRKGVVEGIDFYNKYLKDKGYVLYIIGPNKKSLDGYSSEYISIFNSKLSNNINYLGEVDFLVVSDYLRRAQYLIHLSLSEGMPNIVLESMAYSCFPITLSMDGLYSELFDNGISGFNIELLNFENLNMVNDAGYNKICNNHSFSIISEKTYLIYQGMLTK
ncbi:TPA: glycosyltransferase family 4 protein [Photobacterium damselae]